MQKRIQESPREGAPTLQEGEPTYTFAKISKELHEIETFLGRRGGAGGAPRSANRMYWTVLINCPR